MQLPTISGDTFQCQSNAELHSKTHTGNRCAKIHTEMNRHFQLFFGYYQAFQMRPAEISAQIREALEPRRQAPGTIQPPCNFWDCSISYSTGPYVHTQPKFLTLGLSQDSQSQILVLLHPHLDLLRQNHRRGRKHEVGHSPQPQRHRAALGGCAR